MSTNKQKPVHEIRIGLIKAAIWANTDSGGITWHSVTFSRIYKHENAWKRSESFGRDDLLVLGKVADLAFEWIHEHAKTPPSESTTVEAEEQPNI